MTDTVIKILNEFEGLVQSGEIASFSVFVKPYSVLFKASEGEREEEVVLSEEMLQTLDSFFSDLDGISYSTYDYDNLKSLLNARIMLDKLCGKTDTI